MLRQQVYLKVVGKIWALCFAMCFDLILTLYFSEPFTEILGGKDVFINLNSDLNLTCVIHAPEPPAHIFWIHDGKVRKSQIFACFG